MGVFSRIAKWFGIGEDEQLESVPKGSIMDENNSTFIYSEEPRMDTAIGMNGEQPMSPSMIVANSQITNADSARRVIPGQRKTRPRGQSAGQPQQMAPVPMQQMPPQQFEAPAAQYPPQYQQQQYQQYPPQYQQYPQQQMMQPPPPPPPPPLNVPVAGMTAGSNQQFGGEPFSEFIMVNGTYHVFIDLPGVKKGSIGIQFRNNTLVVSGERVPRAVEYEKKAKSVKGKKPDFASQINVPDYLLNKFSFEFEIAKAIDENSITAEFEDGQLHVTMALRASVTGINIAIK